MRDYALIILDFAYPLKPNQPPGLRLRPNDTLPPPYQVAGIIDLQQIRNRARAER